VSPVRVSCTWLIAGWALDNDAARKIYLSYYACVHEQRLNNSVLEPRSINFLILHSDDKTLHRIDAASEKILCVYNAH
jgi:hypothetical protein